MIPENAAVQQIAKQVLAELAATISPDSSERTIVATARTLLKQHGIDETWYYDCPALVLLGSRSCLSLSGRVYEPSDECVGQRNLVTVDLSPKLGVFWGDCARSFVIEHGQVVSPPSSAEFQRGIHFIREMHVAMCHFAKPETRFCDLFHFANDWIADAGFENLDFLNNVGHSIATSLNERLYISDGTQQPLGAVKAFTFEPHIRERGGQWGFKHEDIYYFDQFGHPTAL